MRFLLFFFNDTATTEISTLSLHDALPICHHHPQCEKRRTLPSRAVGIEPQHHRPMPQVQAVGDAVARSRRSEEHTSELQSPDHLVCRLLLEKKKKKQRHHVVNVLRYCRQQ